MSTPLTPPQSRSGAQLLVDQLVLHGVRRAFCVPGESYLGVLDALYDVREQIELIVNRQEGGAAFMAEAHGKLTGEPGICLVTRGPGATNAAIGVHHAQQDSTPMILFIGQVGSDFVEREAFQEVDYRRMFGPLCKWVAQIDRADRVAEYVARAFQVATSARPGPVVLALPEDMLSTTAQPVIGLQRYSPVQAAPAASDMAQLHTLLLAAKNPFLIVGGAGWTPTAARELQGFIERYDLPFGGAFRFCDVIANAHPNYAGDVGIGINARLAARVRDADVLITLGARLGEMTTSGYTLLDAPRPAQALVHIYNQPDDLGRVYQGALMVASGMPQAAAALAALPSPTTPLVWAGRAADAHKDLAAWQAEPALLKREPPAVNPWQVVQILKKLAPPNTIITNGAGNFATWANRYWPYEGLASCGHRTQLAPSSGSMGCGVPAAIAAKLEHPQATVVCFAGDGDFLMTGQELATASQYGVGIVILLFNNGMYGTIRMHQERHFAGRVHGTALHNPDFVALATAYGGRGYLVQATTQFEPALTDALIFANTQHRPALIELRVDPELITPSMRIADLRALSGL